MLSTDVSYTSSPAGLTSELGPRDDLATQPAETTHGLDGETIGRGVAIEGEGLTPGRLQAGPRQLGCDGAISLMVGRLICPLHESTD